MIYDSRIRSKFQIADSRLKITSKKKVNELPEKQAKNQVEHHTGRQVDVTDIPGFDISSFHLRHCLWQQSQENDALKDLSDI